MQTNYLIVPMAGTGKRFVDKFYPEYKSFLNTNAKTNILENIFSNFDKRNTKIILIINKKINIDKKLLKSKEITIIKIDGHKFGPLFTIYKAFNFLKKKIDKNSGIFVSYCDINWRWNFKKVLGEIKKNKQILVFTHKGFHPHLEVNSKSDFCKISEGFVTEMSEKQTFSNHYKKDHLAIGCYYFNDISFLKKFFDTFKFIKKKEYYILTLINFWAKQKINIKSFEIDKFVHLGNPEQYTDYLSWREIVKNNLDQESKNSHIFKNNQSIMLMAGKNKRLKKISNFKFNLNYKNTKIYDYIFNFFNSSQKIIITNKDIKNKFFKKRFDYSLIKNTKSMFDTVYKSKKILTNKDSFFLLSCDCYGKFNFIKLRKKIDDFKPSLVIFSFRPSYMQSKLSNSHTQIKTNGDYIMDINIKGKFNRNMLGHAGFFWVSEGKIFNHLNSFKNSSYYKKNSLRREIIIDDYFKFCVLKKKMNIIHHELDYYVHIGSEKEYFEYKYWENFFH